MILHVRVERTINVPPRYASTAARVQAYYESQRGWTFIQQTTEADGSVTLRFWEARGLRD